MDDEGRQLPTANTERSFYEARLSPGAMTITRLLQNPAFRNGVVPNRRSAATWTPRDICSDRSHQESGCDQPRRAKGFTAEVERALLSHPEVAEAVAFPITLRTWRGRRCWPWYCGRRPRSSSQKLRRFASEHLARFKVPGLIRIVPAIPEGLDGKIIRGELATMLSITTPRSRVERSDNRWRPARRAEWQLSKIWADLLELSEVGVDEDVFALGADSLTVGQLLTRLRARFGVDFSFMGYFRCAQPLRFLAARIESSKKEGSSACPACVTSDG